MENPFFVLPELTGQLLTYCNLPDIASLLLVDSRLTSNVLSFRLSLQRRFYPRLTLPAQEHLLRRYAHPLYYQLHHPLLKRACWEGDAELFRLLANFDLSSKRLEGYARVAAAHGQSAVVKLLLPYLVEENYRSIESKALSRLLLTTKRLKKDSVLTLLSLPYGVEREKSREAFNLLLQPLGRWIEQDYYADPALRSYTMSTEAIPYIHNIIKPALIAIREEEWKVVRHLLALLAVKELDKETSSERTMAQKVRIEVLQRLSVHLTTKGSKRAKDGLSSLLTTLSHSDRLFCSLRGGRFDSSLEVVDKQEEFPLTSRLGQAMAQLGGEKKKLFHLRQILATVAHYGSAVLTQRYYEKCCAAGYWEWRRYSRFFEGEGDIRDFPEESLAQLAKEEKWSNEQMETVNALRGEEKLALDMEKFFTP